MASGSITVIHYAFTCFGIVVTINDIRRRSQSYMEQKDLTVFILRTRYFVFKLLDIV